MNYYNEFDPKAAAWLRELIRAGLIPPGDVDERSITEIKPHELSGYTQCHFFAGIGGWSLALQLAGWPATRPVWTGSCPCQPFSAAGKQLGEKDERHLWPVFFDLIRECGPEFVFGEQVANAIGKGWLDGVSADLESAGYACGAAVLGAHSVGAPHIRRRLYWVADAYERACGQGRAIDGGRDSRGDAEPRAGLGGGGDDCGLVLPVCTRLEGYPGYGDDRNQPGRIDALTDGPTPEAGGAMSGKTGGTSGNTSWSRFDLIPCADGKARRIEPGLAPLAHGIPARVVRLRGYGNAIVPEAAAEFIQAFCEC